MNISTGQDSQRLCKYSSSLYSHALHSINSINTSIHRSASLPSKNSPSSSPVSQNAIIVKRGESQNHSNKCPDPFVGITSHNYSHHSHSHQHHPSLPRPPPSHPAPPTPHNSSSCQRMSFDELSSLESPSRINSNPPLLQLSGSRNLQESRPISQISIVLPPINRLPSLDFAVNGTSPLMGPATPSPPSVHPLSSTSKPVDYFGRAWEGVSYKLNDYTHKTPKSAAPRSKEIKSFSLLDNVENESNTRHELKPSRSRASSRHRSANPSNNGKSSKQPSQKAMLSKALQKANTAVLLDNAQNFEGATQAYSEACTLLQQVMLRTSGDEDRRKLEAIRNTYTSRISELEKISPLATGGVSDNGKALPARPDATSRSGNDLDIVSPAEEDEKENTIACRETQSISININNDEICSSDQQPNRSFITSQLPPRRESLLQSSSDSSLFRLDPVYSGNSRSYSKNSSSDETSSSHDIHLEINIPPLSPLIASPTKNKGNSNSTSSTNAGIQHNKWSSDDIASDTSGESLQNGHSRLLSNDSTSWLDTIDEFGDSVAPSTQTRTPSMILRRKTNHQNHHSEGEFDSALDSAVESAYDDGFIPTDEYIDREIVTNVRHRVDLAKENIHQTECSDSVQLVNNNERARLHRQQQLLQNEFEEEQINSSDSDDNENDRVDREEDEDDKTDDDDDEEEEEEEEDEEQEEEHILDEMTKDYAINDFEFGLQSKSARPRESYSSGFSGRTWNSSIGSNPTTIGTILSTVSESSLHQLPQPPKPPSSSSSSSSILNNPLAAPPSPHPPPKQPLPPSPKNSGRTSSSLESISSTTRSGQSKHLQLESCVSSIFDHSEAFVKSIQNRTSSINNHSNSNSNLFSGQSKSSKLNHGRQTTSTSSHPPTLEFPLATSPFPEISAADLIPPFEPISYQNSSNIIDNSFTQSGSPPNIEVKNSLRKTFSSSSLKNLKNRNANTSSIADDGLDTAPSTPISIQFNARNDGTKSHPVIPTLPTPIAMAFKEKQNGNQSGNLYLFNNDVQCLESPGPNPSFDGGTPISLEPCPNEYLLRPFWLMRALYQTITHPKGGYISSKLFVPCDVWRVKGVKIKNIEEKIANCDLLTAALLKLGRVDTLDADAVLEEMLSLESVLEQAQASLAKKLGSEVGTHNFTISGSSKEKEIECDNENMSGSHKLGSISSKSSFSWRRLRSKNSGVSLSHAYSSKIASDGIKEGFTIASLPMTMSSTTKTRFHRRDVTQTHFSGPNANYMSALAKLFDAAQIVDQIARQVEDPGLRHADKTQVGLELCTRHAAEFFGFYVCRFVLTDIAMLLDKFIKKGGEWVVM